MAGDAATNAAARVKPSDQDLAQIDHAAEDNVWHDTPDLSKEGVKKQLKGVYKGTPAEDAQAAVADGTAAAHPTGSTDPTDLANAPDVDAQAGATAAMDTLQQRVGANVSDETKQAVKSKAQEYRARAKEYLSAKMPKDRRDQTIWRLKVSRA